jgi:hypothetical protein
MGNTFCDRPELLEIHIFNYIEKHDEK